MELLPVKREKAIPQIDDFRITKFGPLLCIFSQMPLVHDFWPATLNSLNPQNETLQNTQFFENTTDNYTWLSYFQFKNESKNVAKTRFRPLSNAISSTWPSFLRSKHCISLEFGQGFESLVWAFAIWLVSVCALRWLVDQFDYPLCFAETVWCWTRVLQMLMITGNAL